MLPRAARLLLAFLLSPLTAGCGGGGGGSDTTAADTGSEEAAAESQGDSLDVISLAFKPDDGIRLACAAVPRIGLDQASETCDLYHSSELNSGGAARFVRSADGLDFGDLDHPELATCSADIPGAAGAYAWPMLSASSQ